MMQSANNSSSQRKLIFFHPRGLYNLTALIIIPLKGKLLLELLENPILFTVFGNDIDRFVKQEPCFGKPCRF